MLADPGLAVVSSDGSPTAPTGIAVWCQLALALDHQASNALELSGTATTKEWKDQTRPMTWWRLFPNRQPRSAPTLEGCEASEIDLISVGRHLQAAITEDPSVVLDRFAVKRPRFL